MANIQGSKWGASTLGTAGGTVTWSVVGGGVDISRFDITTLTSVAGASFLGYDFVSVIANAFAEWSRYGDIEFKQVADDGLPAGIGTQADIRIFFGDIPGSTVGFAFYPSSWDSPIAGDVLLDALSDFNSDPDFFANVVLHELGHSLGLGHVDSNAIMTAVVSENGLQTDDIIGIQTIYGVQDGAVMAAGNTQPNSSIHEALNGTAGSDTIQGSSGNDTINGRGGSDWLFGGADNDRLEGRYGNDILLGNYGHDRLLGATGKDLLRGGAGRDTLEGGAHNDALSGGDGNDILIGGHGNDILRGQRHADQFVFENNHGHDRITDFAANSPLEKIDLSLVDGYNGFWDVTNTAQQVGRDVLIQTDVDSSILILNVQLSQLDPGDFLF